MEATLLDKKEKSLGAAIGELSVNERVRRRSPERMGEINDGRRRCCSPTELVHTRKKACEEGDDAGLRLEEKKRDLD